MKSSVKYSDSNPPVQLAKYIEVDEGKNKISNKTIMLLRANNLALSNSNKAYQDKVIEFNKYLKENDIHRILNVLRSLIISK